MATLNDAGAATRWPGTPYLARTLAAVALVLLQGCAVYNSTSDGADSDLMLLGHDPVSYFEAERPQLGRPELTVRHRHGTYRFASADSREKFRSNPERYAPQYGAFCAKGVSYAVRAGGHALVHEIRDGRLFIFVNDYARDYWRTDPADFIAKADGYWSSELEDAPVVWTNRKRSGNPSFVKAMKLRTLRLGNQRTRRGEHGSTADGALPGTGGGVSGLGSDGEGMGRGERRCDAHDRELVRPFATLAGAA